MTDAQSFTSSIEIRRNSLQSEIVISFKMNPPNACQQ